MGMKMAERVGVSRRGKLEPGTKIRQKTANFEPGTDLRRAHRLGILEGGSGFAAGSRLKIFERDHRFAAPASSEREVSTPSR